MEGNRTLFSMTQLLNTIYDMKKLLESTSENEFSEDSRLLLTLYNPIRNATITGMDIDTARIDLTSRYNNIINLIETYRMLVSIKEVINNKYTLKVPEILSGEEVELPISIILVLKSKPIKDFYFKLIEKINKDKSEIVNALEDHQENVMSQDRIDKYVNAKFTSLKMNSMNDLKSANYETFAKEYIDANTLEILDPNNIKDWKKVENNIRKFYSTIDYKLLEFNSTTKIWIIKDDTNNILSWEMADNI